MTDRAQPLPSEPERGDRPAYLGVAATRRVCRAGRPVPGRTSHPVSPYVTLAEARAAGLRPCRRCTPERVTGRQFALARAKVILETSVPAPDLVTLAGLVGLGRAHFQRLFRAAFGLSPKQYALDLRAERLRAGLRAGLSVTAALYEAGHNSPRSVYERATDRLGMTPGSYRRGGERVVIRYTLTDRPAGRALVAATERGLCALWQGEDEALLARLRAEFPHAWLLRDTGALAPYLSTLGEQTPPPPGPGAEWRRRVWEVLGHLDAAPTYAELAALLGLADAEEAVASACEAPPPLLHGPRQASAGWTGPLMSGVV